MKKILITGANGQLGSELKKLNKIHLHKELQFVFTDVEELDITDLKALRTFFFADCFHFIVNCAAYNNVDKAESEPQNAELINATALKNLAAISSELKIPVIHVSTDYVFEGTKDSPYTEEDPVNPITKYGRSKLNGEEHIKSAYKYIIIRTSWLYSVFGHNFVKTMIRLGKEKDSINVVSDQIGSPTNAADLAKAIFEIILKSSDDTKEFKSGIYHYSNEGSCSWYEFAKEIMKFARLNCDVKPILTKDYPTPANRPKYSLMDKTKIKQVYHVSVPFWKDSLKKCILEISDSF